MELNEFGPQQFLRTYSLPRFGLYALPLLKVWDTSSQGKGTLFLGFTSIPGHFSTEDTIDHKKR